MKLLAPDGGYIEGPSYWGYGTRYNVYFLAALETALATRAEEIEVEEGRCPDQLPAGIGLHLPHAGGRIDRLPRLQRLHPGRGAQPRNRPAGLVGDAEAERHPVPLAAVPNPDWRLKRAFRPLVTAAGISGPLEHLEGHESITVMNRERA